MTGDAPERFESRVDRMIREAAERGEFDDLPGAGRPLPLLDEPYDENWWVKRWVRREGITAEELRRARGGGRPAGGPPAG